MDIKYFDNAATTALDKDILEKMMSYFTDNYYNPSSIYKASLNVHNDVLEARKRVALAIGAKTEEIYFTSGGTESDNLAIKGFAYANKSKGNHIITSCIEHPAIINSCKALEREGFEVTYIGVDENGIIKLEELENAIKENTILISVMTANNEIGTIEPIKEIGEIAHKHNIKFHTDAVQAIGSVNINVDDMNKLMLLFWIASASFIGTFPFLILPSLVASTDVLKDGLSGTNVFKSWFYAFKRYFLKSMLVGLIYSGLFLIVWFCLYFYSNANLMDFSNVFGENVAQVLSKIQTFMFQAGFVVILLFAIILCLLVVHIPMVIITLPRMRVIDMLKTNVFMAINYFLNTIVLFAMLIVSIIGFAFFPIWIIFGISLPILIGLRFSKVNYRELEKVDFDKINKQVEKDLEEEELYE